MATLIPTDISGLTNSREHKYELEILIYLRDNLPREWTVFHSVHWSGRRGDRNRFGEIDFVVMAPSGKVVVIEQKNGALCERGDRLVKIYGSSGYEQEKDVHQQIAAS